MEARTVLSGDVDVIVTDGFSGNILLKNIEGTAKSVVKSMIGLIKKHAGEGTDLSYIKRAVADFNATYDFNTMGAAVVLGLKKPILKAHGAANSDTVVNTVKQAMRILKSL
jgi:glycerol-3-phosphate acyltransferase PlsX